MNELRDPGPAARLATVKSDPDVPGVVFQRLCEKESLRDIAKEWQLPQGQFIAWYMEKHVTLYDTAMRVLAGDFAAETVQIADEQKEATDSKGNKFDPEVPRDKLRIEARFRLLPYLDRARYGSKDQGAGGGGITVIVDRSCGGTVEISAGGATARIPMGPGGVSEERVISGTEASADEALVL